LADPSELVNADAVAEIEAKTAAIKDGSFAPFTGPIKNQDGDEVLKAGEKAELGALLSMDYFVEGVLGSPKG
ncbi:MAG: BMP family ABC transporter substrate-binding protein, partial [Actinomycetota bacterium]